MFPASISSAIVPLCFIKHFLSKWLSNVVKFNLPHMFFLFHHHQWREPTVPKSLNGVRTWFHRFSGEDFYDGTHVAISLVVVPLLPICICICIYIYIMCVYIYIYDYICISVCVYVYPTISTSACRCPTFSRDGRLPTLERLKRLTLWTWLSSSRSTSSSWSSPLPTS